MSIPLSGCLWKRNSKTICYQILLGIGALCCKVEYKDILSLPLLFLRLLAFINIIIVSYQKKK